MLFLLHQIQLTLIKVNSDNNNTIILIFNRQFGSYPPTNCFLKQQINLTMKTAERQRALSSRLNRNLSNNLDKSRQKYYESVSNSQISHQQKIYNRNFFLRQAYRASIEKQHQAEINSLANTQKIDPSSYKILKQKLDHQIGKALHNVCTQNDPAHQQELTFEQMSEIIFRTNEYLRKAENAIDVEQFFSQLWLYLKNYQIQNQYLDANIFCTFIKILMDPKGIKPIEIKQLMMTVEPFKHSNHLLNQFIQQYRELEEEALTDIEIFKLWYTIRQKYHIFYKHQENSHHHSRKFLHKNQFTFQPQINQNSRIYAQKSLKKYLSSHKLVNQRTIKQSQFNEQQNELHQYLSHKVMGNSNLQKKSIGSLEKGDFSYHDLLYKRKLQKEDLSRRINLDETSFKENIHSRKAHPSEIQQIVDKMYYVPQKKHDIDYQSLKEEEQLKRCTFHPTTLDYQNTKRNNANVNGFQKQVERLKKGRQEKQKLKQIYENLGKPKNTKGHVRTPSFLERDTPKLILQVNIGGGRIQKIKLHGNEDAKIVAKRFISKHSLQNSMLSVLEELIDENLRNL